MSSWPDVLVQVCLVMRHRHPEEFERILEVKGRRLPYFFRSREDVHQLKSVGDMGIYASCQGTGAQLERRVRRVLELFGYPRDSLAVQSR